MSERITSEPGDDNVPSWSRNGQWIYFHSARSGQSQVWKARTDGSGAVQVARRGGFAAVESPDRRFLYYSKETPDGPALWRMPVDGGEENEVVPGISDWRYFALLDHRGYFIARRAYCSSVRRFLISAMVRSRRS